MEVLMSDYQLEKIYDGRHVDWNDQVPRLWVLHADKTPPHIGISVEGSYFSLKANGKDDGLPIELLLSVLDKKSIKTISFEVKASFTVQKAAFVFDQFTSTVPNETSCLAPIKELLDIDSANQLNDLLIALDTESRIVNTVGFNISQDFKNFKKYTMEDVHARLKLLANNND